MSTAPRRRQPPTGPLPAGRGYTAVELTVALSLLVLLTFAAARTIVATGQVASGTIGALQVERTLSAAAVQIDLDVAAITSCAADRHTAAFAHLDPQRVELYADADADGLADRVTYTTDTGELVRHVDTGDGTCAFPVDYSVASDRPVGEVLLPSFAGTFSFDDDLGTAAEAGPWGSCAAGPTGTIPTACDVSTLTLTGTADVDGHTVQVTTTRPVPAGLFTP